MVSGALLLCYTSTVLCPNFDFIMSLAKLTAVSTKTLSLILERQRLQTLPSYSRDGKSNGSSLHYPQIKRNLVQLREGISALEAKEGSLTDTTKLLRSQYERMRGMLWEEERAEIPRSVIFALS